MSNLRAVIDRFEGRMAVLLVGDVEQRLVLPRNVLPKEALEGTVLNISFEIDQTATNDTKRRVQDLIDRLSRGDS